MPFLHEVSDVEDALTNVRSRVGRALRNREMVLDLYVRILGEALEEMKKREVVAGDGAGEVGRGGRGGGSSSGCGQVAFEEEAGLSRVMEMNGPGIMLTVD